MSHLISQTSNRYHWHLQQMNKIKEKNNFCIFIRTGIFYTGHAFLPLHILSIKRNLSTSCCQGSTYSLAIPNTVTYLMKVSEICCLFIWKFFQPSGSFTRSLLENQPASSENLKANEGIRLSIFSHEFCNARNLSIQLIYWKEIFLNVLTERSF